VARRRATLGAREPLRILGAVRTRPVAQLGQVAGPGRGPALGPAIARRVLAGVVGPVALVERAGLRVLGARRAARLLLVHRAGLARDAGAGLDLVALAHRRPADKGARPHHVARAGSAGAGAGLVGIAYVARAVAADRAGVAGRVLTRIARAVAGVGRTGVAVICAGRAGRLLPIGRAARPGDAGAHLGLIALARRGAADDRARRWAGRRAGGAGAGAVLRGVADVARARLADRARIACRMRTD